VFKTIHKKFERKETDLYELQQQVGFSRYILVRSLANDHLKELINFTTGIDIKKGKTEELYDTLYTSSISENEIIDYIRKKYPEVRKESRISRK
jgi:hypothetical protein